MVHDKIQIFDRLIFQRYHVDYADRPHWSTNYNIGPIVIFFLDATAMGYDKLISLVFNFFDQANILYWSADNNISLVIIFFLDTTAMGYD
jgi:hypothetical protein